MSSNQIIEASKVRVGDTLRVTRVSTYNKGVVRQASRTYEGKVERFNEGESGALLKGADGYAEWIGLRPNEVTTVLIERLDRAYQPGEMYRVHVAGDHEHTVRIWTRETNGWRTTSGLRADPVDTVTIGDRVTLTPQ